MLYHHRHTTRKTVGSAELAYLLVVIAAGAVTAWWASHQVGIDLSSVNQAAAMLGLSEQSPVPHAAVGYTGAAEQDQASAPALPYCQAGAAPALSAAATRLRDQVGANIVGHPVECEHAATGSGDTIEQTSTGLLAYRAITDAESFTDGWRHWRLTPNGLVTWEGTGSDPPPG
jgi:hypothetical protein